MGDFRGSLETRYEAIALNERMVEQVPDDRRWRNARARSKFLLAELLTVLDDRAALEYVAAAITELTALVTHDPENAGWSRDLAYAYTVASQASYQFHDAGAATQHARQAVAMMRALHESDAERADWETLLARAGMAEARALHDAGNPEAALDAMSTAAPKGGELDSASLQVSLDILQGRILASLGRARSSTAFEAAIGVADQDLNLEDAYERAQWVEAHLRAEQTAGLEDAITELLAAGYRSRDFMEACVTAAGLCDDLRTAR
jgi:hypothetical protein